MKKIIVLNKKEGETPLRVLDNFKKNNSKYLNVSMTYAGRLDPMASGVLILLTGEEAKNREKYLSLDKEYVFSILFGFRTDTYDILGKVLKCDPYNISQKHLLEQIKDNLKYFRGKIKQKYPIYSSKTVNGKPLFEYARRGKKVKIPEKEILIKKIIVKNIRKINSDNLLKNIEKRIGKVVGDFRQEEILKLWHKELSNTNKSPFFYLVNFEIKCGSGTYVRAIANSLGEKIGIPTLAFSIKRTKVGKFFL